MTKEKMIIGIAGGSCSGKTSVSRLLAKELKAEVISADDYFVDPATLPKAYGHPYLDRLEAVNWQQLLYDVRAARREHDLVVEGFLVLTQPALREMFDLSFFIDTEPSVMSARRRLKHPDLNPDYIANIMTGRYHELVYPTSHLASYIIDGNQELGKIQSDISAKL